MASRSGRPRARLTAALALPLALALLLTGCGDSSGGGGDDGTGSVAAETADRVEPLEGPAPEPALPTTVTSADGEEVTVTSVEKVVPLSGSLSELVFSLGLGDRVVARDVSATFEQAADLPVVTRGHDVSAEGVLSMRPDLVLAESTTGPDEAIDQIRAAGVPLVVLDPALELDDIERRITAVAETLGVPEAGQALTARTTERLDAVRAELPTDGDRPRVAFLYLRGSASVYLLGGAESGAVSLIEAAGGVDAGSESGLDGDFTPITSEALAAAAPDVILVMTKGLESVGGVDGLVEIPGIAQTPAGMNRRVASVDDGVLLNYGPRTDQVLASLAEQIHAEEPAA
ncbi:ABC transporter substrate-binding protein [Streptomyces sp. 3MP-14]|uniref:ABC transporter substrate-binding protein n=1 Tax=Streptomyces mimosae TaxID=2586635 RepID=A0A5N6ALC9_9ACTN|nr:MULTISPECIES: ABC transporter substrate-binding protein [Streptomyces]KAB8168519.1 ABC transporter substrate-binding protein [Streptomyces mimosae]KAB8178200.1 ABC transporter substrate-binding protein [Streptomyces sp. 3MP-14]